MTAPTPEANGASSEPKRTKADAIRIIASWLRLFVAPEAVTEVRAVGIKTQYGKPYVESGYFDYENLDKAAAEAFRLSVTAKARGVYFLPNPIDQTLLARRANRVERVNEGDATTNDKILRRWWLMIDADPARDAKISSSDAEKAEALTVILAVREFLRGRGWPDPIRGDSGNGHHLDYRIDLPVDDGGLVQRVLLALSQRFSTQTVKIDTVVHAAACPMKLYGTVARKGDDVPALNRVHRGSQILEIPGCIDPCDAAAADLRIVPTGLLEALAAEAKEESKATPPPGPKPSTNGHGYDHRLDVPKWLTARGVDFRVKGSPASGDRTVYLITCPFDPAHTGGDTCVMQEPSGKLSAHCFHNSCSGRGWQEFKEKIGKPDGDHYDPPMGKKKGQRSKQKRKKSPGGNGQRQTDETGSGCTIIVNNRQLPDVTGEALEALRAANNPPRVFQRGGLLTRLFIDRKTMAPTLQVMHEHAVRGRLARVATWVQETEDDLINVSPPMDVVRDVINLDEWEHVPPLQKIIETPAFVGDGRLVCTPGYDALSHTYYKPAPGLEIPTVSKKPTKDEVTEARSLLLVELLGDFPFNDGPTKDDNTGVNGTASKAHALAALLLSFVREMIDGPTPFHLFDAPVEGTGKTLLVTSISVVGVGRAIDGIAEATCDEEWRKRITATLVEAPTYFFLDNLSRILDSGALASALTANVWKDRVLGFTKTVAVPNNAVWMGSGNNTRLSREIIRRTVWCRLDSRTDAPWERTGFKHKHLIRWAKANRGRLVWAALTLCQAWIAADRPSGEETLGMFESWTEVIGGILGVAGVPGLLTNAKSFRAAATDRGSEWREFVAAWWTKYAGERVGVDALFALATEQKLLDSVLGDKGERSQRTKMGMALSKMRDRVIGDHRVVWVQEDNSNRQCYRLELIPKEQAAAGGTAPTEGEQDAAPDEEAFEMEG